MAKSRVHLSYSLAVILLLMLEVNAANITYTEDFESLTPGTTTLPTGWTIITTSGPSTYANITGYGATVSGNFTSDNDSTNLTYPANYIANSGNVAFNLEYPVSGNFHFKLDGTTNYINAHFMIGDIAQGVNSDAGQFLNLFLMKNSFGNKAHIKDGLGTALTSNQNLSGSVWNLCSFTWTPTNNLTGDLSVTISESNSWTDTYSGFTFDNKRAYFGYGTAGYWSNNEWTVHIDNIHLTGTQLFELQWDANAGTAGITDGAGTWLNANQWTDSVTNSTWNNISVFDALIGNGGTGGKITTGNVIAGNITFNNFSGTYEIENTTSSNVTFNGNIVIEEDAGNVTLDTELYGQGGIIKNGTGTLIIEDYATEVNNYQGDTVVNGGILQIGTSWNNSNSIPGGWSGNATTGSTLVINEGTVAVWFNGARSLGSGPGQIQLIGGNCGITMRQGDRHDWIVGNNSSYEIVWGSTHFSPASFVFNDANASAATWLQISNPIDLNGSTRTVSVSDSDTSKYGQIAGVIRNSLSNGAGLIKTGAGVLRLTQTNTYDGDTRVNEGVLYMSQACFDDASDIYIETGATLNLQHGGTDTIDRLYAHGEWRGTMTNETWGGFGSGADQQVSWLTGTGKLQITTPNIGSPLIRLD